MFNGEGFDEGQPGEIFGGIAGAIFAVGEGEWPAFICWDGLGIGSPAMV
jgi:hypothetical protein